MSVAPVTPRALAAGRECNIALTDAGRGTVALSVSAPAGPIQLIMPLHADEHIVGFGEQFVDIDQRGRVIDGWIDSILHADPRSSYHVAPLYHSSRGYSLHVDTHSRWSADVGVGDESRLVFSAPENQLTAHLYTGDPAATLQAMSARTGTPAIPPDWAFSPWLAARSGTDAVLSEVRRLRDAGIPFASVWVDDYYDRATNSGAGISYPYPRGDYDDVRRLTDQLHALGVRALGYVNCVLYRDTPWYDDAVGRGLAVCDENGCTHHFRFFHPEHQSGPGDRQWGIVMEDDVAALLDFEQPQAREMWQQGVTRMVVDDGWDGWMQDFGEQHPDARSHNRYPLKYHEATAEVMRKLGRDTLFFVRSGGVGTQAFAPITWGGDQVFDWSRERGLASLIPAGVSAGLSGVAVWCPDIAGLVPPASADERSEPDEELWIRWMQFGALSPIMRVHLGFKERDRVDVNVWTSERTTRLFRKYAELHERLRPYLVAQAHSASVTGMPVLRAMLLEFPHDLECWSLGHQYMLGDALLVAPVIEQGAVERTLYLPKGDWRSFWTDATVRGPGWITIEAPIDQIPVFIRNGMPSPL